MARLTARTRWLIACSLLATSVLAFATGYLTVNNALNHRPTAARPTPPAAALSFQTPSAGGTPTSTVEFPGQVVGDRASEPLMRQKLLAQAINETLRQSLAPRQVAVVADEQRGVFLQLTRPPLEASVEAHLQAVARQIFDRYDQILSLDVVLPGQSQALATFTRGPSSRQIYYVPKPVSPELTPALIQQLKERYRESLKAFDLSTPGPAQVALVAQRDLVNYERGASTGRLLAQELGVNVLVNAPWGETVGYFSPQGEWQSLAGSSANPEFLLARLRYTFRERLGDFNLVSSGSQLNLSFTEQAFAANRLTPGSLRERAAVGAEIARQTRQPVAVYLPNGTLIGRFDAKGSWQPQSGFGEAMPGEPGLRQGLEAPPGAADFEPGLGGRDASEAPPPAGNTGETFP